MMPRHFHSYNPAESATQHICEISHDACDPSALLLTHALLHLCLVTTPKPLSHAALLLPLPLNRISSLLPSIPLIPSASFLTHALLHLCLVTTPKPLSHAASFLPLLLNRISSLPTHSCLTTSRYRTHTRPPPVAILILQP